MSANQALLSTDVLRGLVLAATRAPSGHNTQPWTFEVHGNQIRVRPDRARRLPVVDPDDHALFISLGCAVENLVVAAAARGLHAQVTLQDETVVVTLVSGTVADEVLARAIPLRQSNRRNYDGRPLDRAIQARLLDATCRFDGVRVLALATDEPGIEPVIGLIKDASRAQFSDRRFVDELIDWIRFSSREVRDRGDGLAGRALGFPSVPRWLGRWIMHRVTPASEAARQERAVRSSALVVCVVARAHDVRHWIELGRCFERMALAAAAEGVALAHVNMPCEVEAVRARLAAQLGLEPGEQPLLLVRLGYSPRLPSSPRRPLEQVLHAA